MTHFMYCTQADGIARTVLEEIVDEETKNNKKSFDIFCK
jgi:hypothetical protein